MPPAAKGVTIVTVRSGQAAWASRQKHAGKDEALAISQKAPCFRLRPQHDACQTVMTRYRLYIPPDGGARRPRHARAWPHTFCRALSHARRDLQSQLGLLPVDQWSARVTIADRRVDLPWPCHHRSACAERLPQPPVKIIVPATPGGGSDTFARLIGQHLSEVFGQQFVIDNRPGGGTLIGMEAAINAGADGYTLYLGPSTITLLSLMKKNLPVTVANFDPISLAAILPQLLVIHPSVEARTWRSSSRSPRSSPAS